MNDDVTAVTKYLISTKLKIDETFNNYDIDTLNFINRLCDIVEDRLNSYTTILKSDEMLELVKKDINTLIGNVKVIESAIRLHELHLEKFSLN